jgi:hypothetical protein
MKNPIDLVRNDNGAMMLIITMMILAMLTIISFAGTRTSSTEVMIASNEYMHQQNFYWAEGAAIEAIDIMENIDEVIVGAHPWMATHEGVLNYDDEIFEYWDANIDGDDPNEAVPVAGSIGSGNSGYIAVHHGVLAGDTLDISKPSKHHFSVYGKSQNKGLVMIGMAYAKAF